MGIEIQIGLFAVLFIIVGFLGYKVWQLDKRTKIFWKEEGEYKKLVDKEGKEITRL